MVDAVVVVVMVADAVVQVVIVEFVVASVVVKEGVHDEKGSVDGILVGVAEEEVAGVVVREAK